MSVKYYYNKKKEYELERNSLDKTIFSIIEKNNIVKKSKDKRLHVKPYQEQSNWLIQTKEHFDGEYGDDEDVLNTFREQQLQQMRADQMRFETIDDLKKKMSPEQWGQFIAKTYDMVYNGFKEQRNINKILIFIVIIFSIICPLIIWFLWVWYRKTLPSSCKKKLNTLKERYQKKLLKSKIKDSDSRVKRLKLEKLEKERSKKNRIKSKTSK